MKVVHCSQKKYDKIVDENRVNKDTLYFITNMTWEELKEEAKKMGYHYGSGFIVNDNITLETKRGKYIFIPNGTIYFYQIHRAKGCTLATGRNCDQMLSIMKALQ